MSFFLLWIITLVRDRIKLIPHMCCLETGHLATPGALLFDSTAWRVPAQHSPERRITAQLGRAYHSTVQHDTARHSVPQQARHSMAQHSTAQSCSNSARFWPALYLCLPER